MQVKDTVTAPLAKMIHLPCAVLSTFVMLAIPSVCAAESDVGSIHWGTMAMSLFGGLALFLFGMDQMSRSLKAVAGERMKGILSKLTSNRFMGVSTGAFVTAVIQSSSVTTVLVVGFISAGLMNLSQSVSVIMGANIGTTITAQIVAFKITKASLLMIGFGFTLLFASRNEKTKHHGAMLMGLGLVFFGMTIMSDAMSPLRSYQPFLDLMIKMENPLTGILVAAIFTGLIQSSSATTAIVIVMASQGLITLPAGIALAFGSNVGTCITAILAAIGKPREAVRASAVHVIFNVAGVVLWFYFIDALAEFVVWVSPHHTELTGFDRLAAETPRQIANAHTLFNIANTLIFIGLTTQIASLVEKLIPDKPSVLDQLEVRSKYLDDELLSTPTLALDRVRLEVFHMGDKVDEMYETIMPAILTGEEIELSRIREKDDEVDLLYEQIIDYMGEISKQSLTESQTQEFFALMEAVRSLENVGDIIETNLVDLGLSRIQANVSISQSTRKVLLNFHDIIHRSLQLGIQAVSERNTEVAATVIKMKDEISKLSSQAAVHQAGRLIAGEPKRVPAYAIEGDIIENQKRIYYFCKRMAKTVYSEKGEDAPE